MNNLCVAFAVKSLTSEKLLKSTKKITRAEMAEIAARAIEAKANWPATRATAPFGCVPLLRRSFPYASTRYSQLNQITADNVKQLKLAGAFPLG